MCKAFVLKRKKQREAAFGVRIGQKAPLLAADIQGLDRFEQMDALKCKLAA